MADLAVLIVVAGLAIALGLWLFAHLGAVVGVALLVVLVASVFTALGPVLESLPRILAKVAGHANTLPPAPAKEKSTSATVLEAADQAVMSIRSAAALELQEAGRLDQDQRQLLALVEERKTFAREKKLD